jgi:hypothetical protein
MSAHMPGCVWDAARKCYTTIAEGCAAPGEHAKWRHPTFCAVCGEEIVCREDHHRCAPSSRPEER